MLQKNELERILLLILRTPHTIVPSHEHYPIANKLEYASTPTVNAQTVMTSVYGVTKVGARAQIHARLAEKLLTDATILSTIEMDKALFGASTLVTT
jgi:DNA-directed RNA polymerase